LDEEIAVLVDEDDEIIGRAPRSAVRAGNLLHHGVGVLCRDPAGRIYVHKRTDSKDVFPSMYDAFVGGMVQDGESYEDSARRELAEELGIAGPQLRFLFKHRYRGPDNNCWTSVFEVIWDGPIVHQAEEIVWGAWMSPEEVNARLPRWEFVPDGLEIYVEWRSGYQVATTRQGPPEPSSQGTIPT
jgi:isopentenyldiphosphate isomerase